MTEPSAPPENLGLRPLSPPYRPPPDGPPQQAVFASDPSTAAKARNYAREVVEHYAPGIASDRVYDVQLIVSELVTNSLRYGTEPGDMLAVSLNVSAEQVRIEVHDPVRRRPRLKPESAHRQRGRGLFIVDALAARWGVIDRPFGKALWAEVPWQRRATFEPSRGPGSSRP